MPAWITSLLRALVAVPNAFSASTMITSRPACASARAQARPTTPAPTTTQSTRSCDMAALSRRTHRRQAVADSRRAPERALTMPGVTDTPTQIQRRCPQCRQAMAHLVLQGHQGKDVVVDHCVPCRLVWFDALESVQLSGRGWVQALRELQRGARGAPSAQRPAQLPCPSCSSTLKSVHNATRYGR